MNTNNYTIKLDKIKTEIPIEYCIFSDDILPKNNFIGFNYAILHSGFLSIELSGKLFATPNNFGYLTNANSNLISDKIYNLSKIKIHNEYLLTQAPVFRVDVTEDISVNDDPKYYISEYRQILKGCTDKLTVYKYRDMTYITGFSLVPKTLNNFRASVYIKGKEIRKYRNKDYRKNFTKEFLKQTENIIRFECQYRKYKDMRKVFNIRNNKTPTISDILNCKNNVVADFFENLTD